MRVGEADLFKKCQRALLIFLALAAALELPIVENPCPQDKTSKRHEIKQLIKTMSESYPDMKSKVFGAMQRLPLPGWAPADAESIRTKA